MNPPRWFYVVLAGSAALFALGSAARNLSAIGDTRYTYHPRTSEHRGIIFDGRTGKACEESRSNGDTPYLVCYDFIARRIDVWRDSVHRNFPAEAAPPEEPAPAAMDTGMKMMDSTAIKDSIARANAGRR